MLQYPINVYPDKVAFDSTKDTYDRNIHFTFKGDQLTCIFYRIYNYDTQEIVRYGTWHNATYTAMVYNNETFNPTGNVLANLPQGKYILQMMFSETRTNLDHTSYFSTFDRYVSRGKISLGYTAESDTIRVEDKINVIFPWNRIGNSFEHTEANITVSGETVTVRTTDMFMEIGGERARINSYNYETGVIDLRDRLHNNYPSGTPYKMYANFLITDQYYFEVAAEPIIQKMLYDEGLVAELEAKIAETEAEIEEKDIDMTVTSYGNIDMDDREVIEWTQENILLYYNVLRAWGEEPEEWLGTVSTVYGGSSEFNGVEIAYSPMLQTDDGAVFLAPDVVFEYIESLIETLSDNWTTEQLIAADATGLTIDGVAINKLIADAGENAIKVGESLHYIGDYGALAMLQDQLHDALNETVWVTWNAHGGTFAGYFWQRDSALIQDGAGLKYFKVKLDKMQDATTAYNVLESEKIYSQKVEYYFADDYDVASLHGGNYETREYRLTVDYVLQNGMTFTQQYTTVQPMRDNSKSVSNIISDLSNNENRVEVQWTEPDGGLNLSYRVYRIDADGLYNPNERQDKQHQDYANNPKKTLIADVAVGGFIDYTLGNHKRVQYIIVPYNNSVGGTTVYTASVSPVIETDFYGYTITSLKDTGKNADGKSVYFRGNTWKFMSDIQDTDNVQNLNNVMHVGYGKYATSTSTDNNYMSGSLTASLGNMNCTTKTFEDDIEVVNAWRRFISQDCMFVLRSQKGDVWLVKIVDSSSTKYNESVSKLPVDFTFSWVECGNVDDILVVDNLPFGSVDRK